MVFAREKFGTSSRSISTPENRADIVRPDGKHLPRRQRGNSRTNMVLNSIGESAGTDTQSLRSGMGGDRARGSVRAAGHRSCATEVITANPANVQRCDPSPIARRHRLLSERS